MGVVGRDGIDGACAVGEAIVSVARRCLSQGQTVMLGRIPCWSAATASMDTLVAPWSLPYNDDERRATQGDQAIVIYNSWIDGLMSHVGRLSASDTILLADSVSPSLTEGQGE